MFRCECRAVSSQFHFKLVEMFLLDKSKVTVSLYLIRIISPRLCAVF